VEVSLAVYEEITGLPELPPPVDEADYERRKYRRVPFGHRATISLIGTESPDDESTRDVVVVRDVSISGMSFLHAEAIRPGTPFLVEFRGHQDRSVKLRCTAARCEPGGSGGTQFVIGASFDELLTRELPADAGQQAPKLSEVKPPAENTAPAVAETEVEPVLVQEQIKAADRATVAVRAEQPGEPAPAAAPRASALFRTAPAAEQKKSTDEYWHDAAAAIPVPAAPAPQIVTPAKPAPVQDAPVFRVIPLPDPPKEPEPVVVREQPVVAISKGQTGLTQPGSVVAAPAAHLVDRAQPATSVDHQGKSHDILARVKELLVQQEQTIESQRVQINDHRRQFASEIESLRAELQAVKSELAEVRAKSAADDSALADLATFLDQHRNQAA
jgi:hypothetical protein